MAGGLGLRLTVKPVIRGLEYLSELPGPFIFVSNHPSALDARLLREALSGVVPHIVTVSVQAATGIAGITETVLRHRSATRLGELLKRGISVVLFPERRRTDDGSLSEFDLGAAQLGIRTGVPIVPVTLVGTFRAQPPWRTAPEPGRPEVAVLFGRPIEMTPGDEQTAVTKTIVEAITRGLAEEEHGWYGALRADAENTLRASADGDAAPAHWRRVWSATTPDAETRRAVWVETAEL